MTSSGSDVFENLIFGKNQTNMAMDKRQIISEKTMFDIMIDYSLFFINLDRKFFTHKHPKLEHQPPPVWQARTLTLPGRLSDMLNIRCVLKPEMISL